MSTYATMQGQIKFATLEKLEKCLKEVFNWSGWIVDDNFLDETGDIIKSNVVDRENLIIEVPYGFHRNLLHHLEKLPQYGSVTGKWVSNDGMFSGGNLDGSGEVDLNKWAKTNMPEEDEDEPKREDYSSDEEYFQNRMEWQEEVMYEFLNS
mgnify:CR=1 FL=1